MLSPSCPKQEVASQNWNTHSSQPNSKVLRARTISILPAKKIQSLLLFPAPPNTPSSPQGSPPLLPFVVISQSREPSLPCFLSFVCELVKRFEEVVSTVVIAQSLSRVWLFVTLWGAAHRASLCFAISWRMLKLMSIESVMTSNHLILCHPLLLLPSTFSSIRIATVPGIILNSLCKLENNASKSIFCANGSEIPLTGSLALVLRNKISDRSVSLGHFKGKRHWASGEWVQGWRLCLTDAQSGRKLTAVLKPLVSSA